MFFFHKKVKFPSQPSSDSPYTNFKHLKDEKLYLDNEYALELLKNNLNNDTVKTKNISYMYLSVVDSNLMFKEMYSGYTGQVIKTVDPIYQINMK